MTKHTPEDELRKLNRLVAETLGYSVRSYKNGPVTQFQLIPPEGRLLKRHVISAYDEEYAWRNCPYFSTDIGAAITLVPESDKDHRFWLKRLHHVWSATIEDYSLSPDDCYFNEDGATPAEAIVRAWLAWKGVEGQGDG